MRSMSFSLTTRQVQARSKTVTRRNGWQWLKAGALLLPVRKSMGLRRGEKVEAIAPPIRVIDVRRERLGALVADVEYGLREVELEGFGDHPILRWPSAFVAMFCSTHKSCRPDSTITRIEFAYLPGPLPDALDPQFQLDLGP
jgi:hypothetical protein